MVSRKPLVASLTSAGFGVVELNYVGSWSNDGEFSWFGGVKDAEAVVRYLRSAEAKAMGLDGVGIILVGHSYGGWVAMTTAVRDSALRCVAALASSDMGRTGQLMKHSSSFRDERIALYEEVLSASPPLFRASSAKSLADDAVAHADSWGLVKQVDLLRTKQLLLVAAENDTVTPKDSYFEPLVSALTRSSAPSVRTFVIAGADHNFSRLRPELDRLVLQWITEECRPS
jgi:alpha/beta superfamily hydrolase